MPAHTQLHQGQLPPLLNLAETFRKNEDQPCLKSSSSCFISSNTTKHQPRQKAEEIVVVRSFASYSNTTAAKWEKIEALRRTPFSQAVPPGFVAAAAAAAAVAVVDAGAHTATPGSATAVAELG